MKGRFTDDRAREALGRVLAGDRDAYGEIVSGCQDALRGVLGGFCRSLEELEEFCHLALVETYFKLGDYRPQRGPFLPWFLAVARNAVLEELRRRRAEGRRLFRYVERAASQGPPHEEIDRARTALERCLSELEPDDARVLSDHYRDGRGCDEIAAAIGKSGPAVRKILQRLRERLRACVEKRIVAAEGAGP